MREPCFPDRTQRLLLKAALLQGETARAAYEEWRGLADLEKLDAGSVWLLPLLRRNLVKQGVAVRQEEKYKSVYRLIWARNQLMRERLSEAVAALNGAGIVPLVLKGQSLIERYYRDYGLRRMADIDLLVPTTRAEKAIALIEGLGWRTKGSPLPKPLADNFLVLTGDSYGNSAGLELDLHWHLLFESCREESDQLFWRDAVTFKVGKTEALALSPTDLLFHLVVHGVRWNYVPPLRWIADTCLVIKGGEIAWPRLVELAVRFKVVLPVYRGLALLKAEFQAAVPELVLQELRAQKVSFLERLEYRARVAGGSFGKLWLHYRRYQKIRPPFGFSEYLCRVWRVGSLRRLPFFAVKNGLRRLFRITKH